MLMSKMTTVVKMTVQNAKYNTPWIIPVMHIANLANKNTEANHRQSDVPGFVPSLFFWKKRKGYNSSRNDGSSTKVTNIAIATMA